MVFIVPGEKFSEAYGNAATTKRAIQRFPRALIFLGAPFSEPT